MNVQKKSCRPTAFNTGVFFSKFCKIFNNTFFIEHLRATVSEWDCKTMLRYEDTEKKNSAIFFSDHEKVNYILKNEYVQENIHDSTQNLFYHIFRVCTLFMNLF